MYSLEGVRKGYGIVSVLNDITCKIPISGFVAVMGPSGSGKSTLLRHLSFIEIPDQGRIDLVLDGTTFSSAGTTRPWPLVTCVFQKLFLWPHLTLRENLRLPLRTAGCADTEEKLANVTDLFDMAGFIDRFPNEVSGGQAQRAALARALVLDPRVILIDEAHTGLDLEQQCILNEHLLALRATGVGLIIVTHSLNFARRFADHVVIIEAGKIVEIGSRAVLKKPVSAYLNRAIGLTDIERQS